MFKYEDVKDITTEEYFKNNTFSIDAFKKKYAINPTETYPQALKRVCDYVASVEPTKELQKYWSERWFDEIYDDWWHPAGSIMQGAGSGRKISLANCFSSDTEFITNKGVKTFNDFSDGDFVDVLTNYGGYKPAIIKSFGYQKLYNLTVMRNGIYKEVKCTIDHLWRTLEKDTIVVKTTKELKKNNLLPYIKRKSMGDGDDAANRYFCPIGFIHGLVYGDGYYNKECNFCSLDLCGDSKQFIKYFKGFNWKIYEQDDRIRISYLPNYMKEMPDFNKVNSEYILGFIKGWFAAGGTIDSKGRAVLCHNNLDNLIKIKGILEAVGIYSSEIQTKRETNDIEIQGKKYHSEKGYNLYSLYFIKDTLYESFFTKESHKINYNNYIKSIQNDKSRVQWKVISIDETDLYEQVWCVVEPETHNFTLSGGLNTHNCTTISMGSIDEKNEWDNLESIFKNGAYTVAKTAAYRQGLGVDFSRLRPKGSQVLNSAVESTGAIHWMKLIDSIGYYVGQKGRIPAMLFSLSIKHPDIEEFITVKSDYTKIQNANISVQITNYFYTAVYNNEDWDLSFTIPPIKKGQKIYLDEHSIDKDCKKELIQPHREGDPERYRYYKIAAKDGKEQIITRKIKARKLLELIAENMFKNAEPGIQNIDMAREYSNSDAVYDPNDEYDSRIISTNACSEQYLSRESLCVLASENVERFSTNVDEYKVEQKKIAESMQRFLDNVNECELVYQTYATPHQRLAIEKLRRTGAGVTNIGGWLFKLNLEYGTKQANDSMEEFMKWYAYYLYETNIQLGKEKGNFGLFDAKKIRKSKFIQHMVKEFPELKFDTMRNVTSVSIAPTGTLTLMFTKMPMSYGTEPGFGITYWKRTRISGKYEYYFIVPSIVREVFAKAGYPIPMESDTIKDTWDGKYGLPIVKFIEENKDKVDIHFKNSTEISAFDKLNLMGQIMKWVDSSISVTYMLPENTSTKKVYDFILKAYEKGVKSIAAFPDKKMYGIISYIPFKDLALKLKSEGIEIHAQNFDEKELEVMNISDDYISASSAPKRPKVLPADVYSVIVKGEKFVVAIGLLNKAPYEIFCGKMNGLNFKFQHKEGQIEKVKKGQYKLEIGEEIIVEDFSGYFKPVEAELFRMVSTSLRHGVPLKFIVEQLSKSSQDISSLTSAAARVLKKYIKEGEIATGIVCPQCGGQVIYDETGCNKCTKCGWSKCN